MDILSLLAPGGGGDTTVAVIPVIVGPLQALLAVLPGILVALGGLIVSMFKPSAMKRFVQLLWSQKFIVLLIVGGVWGLIYAFGAIFPSTAAAVGGMEPTKTMWSVWRGSPTRRGWVPGVEDPAHGKITWQFAPQKAKVFMSSPAVVGNRVYATSVWVSPFGGDQGGVFCLDADSGKQVWAFRGDGYRSTFSSPAVEGKYLVVGEGLHDTADARVFCLDIQESEKAREGVKLWDYRVKSHVESSPCIAGGKAFVGAGDDGFYCFLLEQKDPRHVEPLWHLEGKDFPDCETSPVCVDDKVYFSLGNGGQAIVCADANKGTVLWKLKTPYPVFGCPAVSGGRLYAGMGYGDYVDDAAQTAKKLADEMKKAGKTEAEIEAATRDIRPIGEVWCVDLKTHEPVWKYQVKDTVLGAVAVDNDRVYFGSQDHNLYCISTDGKFLRKWDARSPLKTAPAVGEKYVYVVTTTGQLYALDKSNLSLVWDVTVNAMSISSPAVARGHVYMGTNGASTASDGVGLLCVGEPGLEKREAVWPGALGGPGKGGALDGSLLPAKSEYAWAAGGPESSSSTGDGSSSAAPPPVIRAPAAFLGGAFYVGIEENGSRGLARYDCGDSLRNKATLSWVAKSANPVYLSAAATERGVFFVDGRAGDKDRALRCLDPKDGRERWQMPVAADAGGEFFIARGRLFIADTSKGLTCLDASSLDVRKELWRADVGPCVGGAGFVDDMVLVAVALPAQAVALDLESGAVVWRQALTSAPQTGPLCASSRAWIGQADGLWGYSLLSGEEPLAVRCGDVVGTLVANADYVAARTRGNVLVLVNPADGKEVSRIEGLVGVEPPLMVDDGLLYNVEGAIQRYSFVSGQSEQWFRMRASWPGTMVSPMIMVDSNVFFATDKKGLICLKPKSQ